MNRKHDGFWDMDMNKKGIDSFFNCPWKHILWYTLEAPCRGSSNEYTHFHE